MLNLISKFALLILLAAVLTLILTGNLISESLLVIALQILAITLSIWARRSFQSNQFSIHAEPAEGKLISKGPYKFIRHPMYTAALLLIWVSIFGHLTTLTFFIGFIVTGVTAVRILTEEKYLRKHFTDYGEYMLHTKRLIPYII